MNKPFNIIIKSHLGPVGGPNGYLYNLDASLKESDIDLIRIISTGLTPQKKIRKKNKLKSLIRFLKLKYTPSSIRYNYIIGKEKKAYDEFFNSIQKDISDSKINNFHLTNDFYYYKKTQASNLTPTAIMSHSPELPHIELLKALEDNRYSKATATKLFNRQKMIDIYAFKNADYIIFPCEEAVSPYDEFIEKYSIDRNKLRFVITSSRPISFKIPRDEFRAKYHISDDTTVLAYIGRKSKIKGYNIFCQAALNLNKEKDFMFLSAGGGAIKTPKTNNIIDFGWTNDPGSILNACDYVIVPNSDTYFDIAIIQALSLNKTIITTPTGGNRWFVDKNLNMIFIDYDADQLTKCIRELRQVSNTLNKDFFDQYLSNKHFAKNYLDLFNSIINENM